MIINVKGCEEYILYILSQCGEANIDLICDAVPYDNSYVIKTISTLKRKRLIKYDNFYPVYILNKDKGILYPSMEKKMKSEFSIITRSGINKKTSMNACRKIKMVKLFFCLMTIIHWAHI